MYKMFFKRVLDILVSLFAIVFAAPILLVAATLVKLGSRGPAFFVQERVGKDGEIFLFYKLRTMTDVPRVSNREIKGKDAEVTKVGYVLRRLKIDELPQIYSILKGDMSIVGPRPFLPAKLEALDENGKWRLKVRPGLTGLAQVNGGIYISWPERWVYDRQYVENLSFAMDLSIIFKTVGIVILGESKFAKRS